MLMLMNQSQDDSGQYGMKGNHDTENYFGRRWGGQPKNEIGERKSFRKDRYGTMIWDDMVWWNMAL